MKLPDTHEARRLAEEVQSFNEYLNTFEIGGCTHRGLNRLFNEGDRPDFNWDRGGRLYSIGADTYQTMKKELRSFITFNGEPTVEVDVSSSYLVVLHGLLGLPFDPTLDAYGFEHLDRTLVKLWTVATLGSPKHLTRWSPGICRDYRDQFGVNPSKRHTIKEIREAMLERFPALGNWGNSGVTWANLMFAESQAIMRAMDVLKSLWNVPSLPVHDSLIVRARDVTHAVGALQSSFSYQFKIVPMVKVDGRPSGSS